MSNNYWQKFEENTVYHLYNRGIDRKPIFTKDENYKFFLRKWKQLISPFCEAGAYCLLPNHFHFMVWLKSLDNSLLSKIKVQGTAKSLKYLEGKISYNQFLESQFKRLFSSYALAFNKQENRTGSLFDKRFKRVGVAEERYTQLIAYIHHNPIHHGIASNYGDWNYCSYSAFKSNKKTSISIDVVNDWYHKEGLDFDLFHKQFKIDYKELQITNFEQL